MDRAAKKKGKYVWQIPICTEGKVKFLCN